MFWACWFLDTFSFTDNEGSPCFVTSSSVCIQNREGPCFAARQSFVATGQYFGFKRLYLATCLLLATEPDELADEPARRDFKVPCFLMGLHDCSREGLNFGKFHGNLNTNSAAHWCRFQRRFYPFDFFGRAVCTDATWQP